MYIIPLTPLRWQTACVGRCTKSHFFSQCSYFVTQLVAGAVVRSNVLRQNLSHLLTCFCKVRISYQQQPVAAEVLASRVYDMLCHKMSIACLYQKTWSVYHQIHSVPSPCFPQLFSSRRFVWTFLQWEVVHCPLSNFMLFCCSCETLAL